MSFRWSNEGLREKSSKSKYVSEAYNAVAETEHEHGNSFRAGKWSTSETPIPGKKRKWPMPKVCRIKRSENNWKSNYSTNISLSLTESFICLIESLTSPTDKFNTSNGHILNWKNCSMVECFSSTIKGEAIKIDDEAWACTFTIKNANTLIFISLTLCYLNDHIVYHREWDYF